MFKIKTTKCWTSKCTMVKIGLDRIGLVWIELCQMKWWHGAQLWFENIHPLNGPCVCCERLMLNIFLFLSFKRTTINKFGLLQWRREKKPIFMAIFIVIVGAFFYVFFSYIILSMRLLPYWQKYTYSWNVFIARKSRWSMIWHNKLGSMLWNDIQRTNAYVNRPLFFFSLSFSLSTSLSVDGFNENCTGEHG